MGFWRRECHAVFFIWALQIVRSDAAIITGPFRGITGCVKGWYFTKHPFSTGSSKTVLGCAGVCTRISGCYSVNACTVTPGYVICSAFGGIASACSELTSDSKCRYLYRTDASQLMAVNPCHNGGTWTGTVCICIWGYAGTYCERFVRSCREAFSLGVRGENFYKVQPFGSPDAYTVYCNCHWVGTVFVFKRLIPPPAGCPPSSLNRTWEDYKHGFGSINCEYFLGLETVYQLSRYSRYQWNIYNVYEVNKYASIYMEDTRIKGEVNNYEVMFVRVFSNSWELGDDAFINAEKPRRFCTWDRDCGNCARTVGGGWWFTSSCKGGAMTAPESQVVWPVRGVNKAVEQTFLQMDHMSYY